jgi:hypothetical protein
VRKRLETGVETAEADLVVSNFAKPSHANASRIKLHCAESEETTERSVPRQESCKFRARCFAEAQRVTSRLLAKDRDVVSTMPEKSPKAHLGSFTLPRPSPSLRHKAYLDLVGNTMAPLVVVMVTSERVLHKVQCVSSLREFPLQALVLPPHQIMRYIALYATLHYLGRRHENAHCTMVSLSRITLFRHVDLI